MTAAAEPRPLSSRIAWPTLAAAAIIAGAWLRAYQLRIQVLVDDEWHALHKVLRSDAYGIATSFGFADHSIPLALYDRFLLLHGSLTEWVMHLPMLIAGVALLVFAALALRREVPLPVRAAWIALLAVSPLLVYHARIARPYALTGLLVPIALVAFHRWWRSERAARWEGAATPWAAAYVATTALAGWLHPTTLAFTLLPLAYRALAALVAQRSSERPSGIAATWRSLAPLAIATALALAALLGPPLVRDWPSLAAKAGADSVSLESLHRTLLMLMGVAQPAALAIMVPVMILGFIRLRSRERDLAAYLATVATVGIALLAASGAAWIHHPLVLARYALPVLPFLLLFLAEGAVALLERMPLPALRAPAAAALVVGFFSLGPIPGYLYYPNQFMGHLRFQYDYDPAHNPYVTQIPSDPVPEFYRTLGKKPPATITLIEAPWRLESNFDPHPWYQEIHRQFVKIGLVTPVCGDRSYGEYPATVTGLRLRQFAHLSSVLAGKSYGADYLVMHLAPWKTPPDAEVEWPDVLACLPAIEAKLGPAVYRDEQIAVFDLKRDSASRTRP